MLNASPLLTIYNGHPLHILFLFLDGIGLGADDAATNPFAAAHLPTLSGLLNGQRLLASTPRTESARALFVPTDANLGVAGLPQSATGQATIVTGLNVPQLVGEHYGPKPNAAVAAIVRRESIFHTLKQNGRRAALLSGYPPRYFAGINSGKHLYSAVPLAVTSAGWPLMTIDEVRAGTAFGSEFTNSGWRTHLKIADVPLYEPAEAGQRLAEAARRYDFAFFEHWLTDYMGHRGTLAEAVNWLETFDAVLGGLLAAWDDAAGLIVLTSDHGNLEDLSHGKHTRNAVPALIIGEARHIFAEGLTDLTGFVSGARRVLEV